MLILSAKDLLIIFLPKELYKENVDTKPTGYQSFSELLRDSMIWKSLGKDKFIAVRAETQKYDTLLLKKGEPAKLNDLQLEAISIMTSKYYGDTF